MNADGGDGSHVAKPLKPPVVEFHDESLPQHAAVREVVHRLGHAALDAHEPIVDLVLVLADDVHHTVGELDAHAQPGVQL